MASDLTTLVPVPGRGVIRFDPLRCLGGPRTGTTSGRIQVLPILVSGQWLLMHRQFHVVSLYGSL